MHGSHLQELLHAHIRSTILLEDVHVRRITIIITMNLLATRVSFSLSLSHSPSLSERLCAWVYGSLRLSDLG